MSSEKNKKEPPKKHSKTKGSFFSRIIKFIITIFLIPLVVASTLSFYDYIRDVQISGDESFFFLLGCLAYLIFHTIIYKPTFLYVFTHEVLHAIPTWLTGGRVKRFRILPKGGSVETTKSNILILLFPYIIPILTLIFVLAYYVAGIFWKEISDHFNFFIFAIGASLTFHIVNTSEALKIEQPDIEQVGYLLSMQIIYIFNLLLISCIFSLISPEFLFLDFLKNLFEKVKEIYIFLYTRLFFV